MSHALWALLAAVAVLWPAALAGPLDGAPLDTAAEVILIGAPLPLVILSDGRALRSRMARAFVVALIAWKVVMAVAVTPDGWCVRFTTPSPIYLDGLTVPHSWDIRADWRSPLPRCSAVMTHAYDVAEAFPAWFFNLAPAAPGHAATREDRPPNVTTALSVEGYLQTSAPGLFRVGAGEDVHVLVRVDDRVVEQPSEVGVALAAGLHRVRIAGDLVRSHWSLAPTWNGASAWSGAVATMDQPGALDAWVRPWGRWVTLVLVLGVIVAAGWPVSTRLGMSWPAALALMLAAVMVAAAASGRESFARASVVALFVAAVPRVPRRWRTGQGAWWLVVAPVVALFSTLASVQAGVFTWYSSGDDWWMFQRFAYRIYLQGHWLEAGEVTFWFQPFYRYLAGALHLVFGDSSAGELLWDAFCAGIGAMFAFRVTRAFAGWRWGIVAAIGTLFSFMLGPSWYLFGRGLSEFSSMGLIYAAALLALRARSRPSPAAFGAGVLAALGGFTRLNNLPLALAVAGFAMPVHMPVSACWQVRLWVSRLSRPVLLGVLGSVCVLLWLLAARTYHYTGVLSMFYGTSAEYFSVWKADGSLIERGWRLVSSLLMLLTLNDPPRLDVRALPVMVGFLAAILGLAGIGRFSRLPMNLVLMGLASVVGAFVSRSVAYPGRFSTHLIPVMLALACCAASLFAPSGGRTGAGAE